jgi:cytochrome o ubiquinol oxidase subunit 3
MTTPQKEPVEELAVENYSKSTWGFWIYLMTDCLLFASLFATYVVLRHETFGGPSASNIFDISSAFSETAILLSSSFACGLALLSARRSKYQTLFWLAVTLALGVSFLSLEFKEFAKFASKGYSWQKSAFLSGYFTLVGTHGLHVTIASIWMFVMMINVFVVGVTAESFRRLVCLNLFWHFLDLVWIFIFTVVYLMGIGNL